ncbi:hypothetical protein K440DRAFT_624455 [Wilcoxina mikolae CBS 423.85]|nr:hypothetical protein K440DRAFT_624455 [Wilcoxina mikolae CBS 423.85]
MEAIYSNDARKVESLVGGFAAGSIATLDIRNPRVQASGLRQVQHGVKVTVKVNYIFIILGLVLGIHLLILIPIVVGYSNGFLPGDESFLDIGVLLKPITNDPESSGREYRYANTPSLVPSARV